MRKKNKLFYMTAFLFILLFTSACSAYNGVNETELKEATSKTYNVGDTVSCPKFDITLNDYIIKTKGQKIDSYSVVADQEWIAVVLTVKNTRDDEKTFYNSNVTIQNSNGEIINASSLSYKIWGYESLNSPTLSSQGVKQGFIQFSNTNQDNSNLILKVSCNDKLLEDDSVFNFYLKK